MKLILEHIQANKVDQAILTLTNSATDLVACNPSYIHARTSGAISKDELGRKCEEECRTLLLIILDKYQPAIYRQMVEIYYQSPESNGQTEENAMRAMPWAGLMALFKKACKIEDLKNTAAYTNAASATHTPSSHVPQPTSGQQKQQDPQDAASAPFTDSHAARDGTTAGS